MQATEDKGYMAYCQRVVERRLSQVAQRSKRLPYLIVASGILPVLPIFAIIHTHSFALHQGAVGGALLLLFLCSVYAEIVSVCYAVVCAVSVKEDRSYGMIVRRHSSSYEEWQRDQAAPARWEALLSEREAVAAKLSTALS